MHSEKTLLIFERGHLPDRLEPKLLQAKELKVGREQAHVGSCDSAGGGSLRRGR